MAIFLYTRKVTFCTVVLDIHPFFTTVVILAGWAVKTSVANYLHPWVSSGAGDVFLAYSIP